MAVLADTNLLVYLFDHRFPAKQLVAEAFLRRGLADGWLRLPHQALIEFVAVVTRRRGGLAPLLSESEAREAAESLLNQFEVLYPDEALLRTAIRGAATYELSWYDAHLWAYAERYALDTLASEDFQHDRVYGSVRIVNPFLEPSE